MFLLLHLLLPSPSLQDAIDGILADPQLKGASVSINVCMPEGSVIYQHDQDRLMIPASNQKLLTSAFALAKLGKDFRCKTEIVRNGRSYAIRTDWDPSWTIPRLKALRTSFPKATTWRIQEPFEPTIPPGWEWDDMPNRYAAPVSALMIEQNGFELKSKNGRLILPWELGLKTRIIKSAGTPKVEYDILRRQITVTGKVPGAESVLDTLAIQDPHAVITRCLGKPTTLGLINGPTLKTFAGPTMAQLLDDCLTNSRNLIAEGLLLRAAQSEGPLTKNPYEVASKRLRTFLTTEVGLETTGVFPVDGSGLSRHNFVSSEAITKLLIWANKQSWSKDFRKHLARPGKGTLKSRLKDIQMEGKTGTSDAVNALSGYLKTANGDEIIFSILVNHTLGSSEEIRAVINRIVNVIATGTNLAYHREHDRASQSLSLPRSGPLAVDRVHRSADHRDSSRKGTDCRAESTYAAPYRTK